MKSVVTLSVSSVTSVFSVAKWEIAMLRDVTEKLLKKENLSFAEAQAALNDILVHAPGLTCSKYRETSFGPPGVMERFLDALREAGLPE